MICNHYPLYVHERQTFTYQDNLKSFLVGVCISCLPIKYLGHAFLMRGGKTGKPIQIDNVVNLVSRGHFVCMFVDVDLEKPLISKLEIHGNVRMIKYGGIHLVCFNCGRYNHKKEEGLFYNQMGLQNQNRN